MKNSIFRMAAVILAAAAIISCAKEQPVAEEATEPETPPECRIDIKLSDGRTKVVDVDEDDEVKLTDVQLFVFDSGNTVESFVHATKEDDLKGVCVTAGAKHIYAVANMDPLENIMQVSDLTGYISLLEDNAPDNLAMVGSVDMTVSDGSSVTIDLYRMVSRLDILKITTDFSARSLADQTFEVDSIYMINVVNECALSRSSIDGRDYAYINKRGFVHSGADELLLDEDCGISIEGNGSVESVHSFYVYPNGCSDDISDAEWCPRLTRLVISAKLGGKRMYYPVNLNITQPNRKYVIEELTITRPGTDNPDQPVSIYECNFKLNVKSWASTDCWREEI